MYVLQIRQVLGQIGGLRLLHILLLHEVNSIHDRRHILEDGGYLLLLDLCNLIYHDLLDPLLRHLVFMLIIYGILLGFSKVLLDLAAVVDAKIIPNTCERPPQPRDMILGHLFNHAYFINQLVSLLQYCLNVALAVLNATYLVEVSFQILLCGCGAEVALVVLQVHRGGVIPVAVALFVFYNLTLMYDSIMAPLFVVAWMRLWKAAAILIKAVVEVKAPVYHVSYTVLVGIVIIRLVYLDYLATVFP